MSEKSTKTALFKYVEHLDRELKWLYDAKGFLVVVQDACD